MQRMGVEIFSLANLHFPAVVIHVRGGENQSTGLVRATNILLHSDCAIQAPHIYTRINCILLLQFSLKKWSLILMSEGAYCVGHVWYLHNMLQILL